MGGGGGDLNCELVRANLVQGERSLRLLISLKVAGPQADCRIARFCSASVTLFATK